MMATELDGMVFTELVGDIETPCDYSDEATCRDAPAAWVLHVTPCGCGMAGVRLACDTCKDFRIASEAAVECERCGYITAPARLAYYLIEPL